jgi:hypothetical protein
MRVVEQEVVIVELHLAELVVVEMELPAVLLLHLRELTTWVAEVEVERVATPHTRSAKMVVKVLSLLNGDSNNGLFCRIR